MKPPYDSTRRFWRASVALTLSLLMVWPAAALAEDAILYTEASNDMALSSVDATTAATTMPVKYEVEPISVASSSGTIGGCTWVTLSDGTLVIAPAEDGDGKLPSGQLIEQIPNLQNGDIINSSSPKA